MAIRIKTSLNNFSEHYKELEDLSKDWNCSIADVARELVFQFYEAAGFYGEALEKEFASFSDDQIIEHYCNLI